MYKYLLIVILTHIFLGSFAQSIRSSIVDSICIQSPDTIAEDFSTEWFDVHYDASSKTYIGIDYTIVQKAGAQYSNFSLHYFSFLHNGNMQAYRPIDSRLLDAFIDWSALKDGQIHTICIHDYYVFDIEKWDIIDQKKLIPNARRDSVHFDIHYNSKMTSDGKGFYYSYTPLVLDGRELAEPFRVCRKYPCIAYYDLENDSIHTLPIHYPSVYHESKYCTMAERLSIDVLKDSVISYAFNGYPWVYYFNIISQEKDSIYLHLPYVTEKELLTHVCFDKYIGHCGLEEHAYSIIQGVKHIGKFLIVNYKKNEELKQIEEKITGERFRYTYFTTVYDLEEKKWVFIKQEKEGTSTSYLINNFVSINNELYAFKTRKSWKEPIVLYKINF